MGKLAEKFKSADNIGAGDNEYLREELKRLKEIAVQEIDLNLIDLIANVRTEYDRENIAELAQSIDRYGLLVPVQVLQTGSRYKLLAGYRRFLAHKGAGKSTINAIIYTKEITQDQIIIIQLIENIQREDLSPYDLERSIQALCDNGHTREEIAQMLNKSKSWVCMILSSKEIREKNLELLREHKVDQVIPASTLSVLASLPQEDTTAILEKILSANKAVTQAELKKQKTQLVKKDKQEQSTLIVKLVEVDGKMTAVIKETGKSLNEYKERFHEFVKTLNIPLNV